MAKLDRIWIERDLAEIGQKEAIRIDWDNARRHRIEIEGDKPADLIRAMDFAVRLMKSELSNELI